MSSEQIEQIEQNIRNAKVHVDFANAIERLRSNKDFKKVISEGYFKDEAVRLVHLKAHPGMQSEASQRSILSQMDSIGNLAQFFDTALHMGAQAAKSISDDEDTRAELAAEELSNG